MYHCPLLCPGAWFAILLMAVAPARAELITFSNTTAINIPALGIANPYPTAITVSGVSGQVFDFTLKLDGVSHTFTDDLAAAVVSPTGAAVLLFSGPGPNFTDTDKVTRVTNQTWTFSDRAAAQMPQRTRVSSGTYQPGLFEYDDSFPSPGPAMNYGFNFSPFIGLNPNGVWSLYVMDNNTGDAGIISRGWSITFDLTPAAVPEPSVLVLSLMGMGAIAWRKRRSAKTKQPTALS